MSLSPFYGTDQKVLSEKNLNACIPHYKKRAHMLLALSQANALRIYYLRAALYFQRTAVDLKQLINTQSQQAFSSGPDNDYRCHETCNLITSMLSFDAISCLQSRANTWLWHLRSSGLSRHDNCHFVGIKSSGGPCLGKMSGHWEVWLYSCDLFTKTMKWFFKVLYFCFSMTWNWNANKENNIELGALITRVGVKCEPGRTAIFIKMKPLLHQSLNFTNQVRKCGTNKR